MVRKLPYPILTHVFWLKKIFCLDPSLQFDTQLLNTDSTNLRLQPQPTTKETTTYFFTVLFLPKNGRKVTRIARFMKNFKKLASKYYSETWNPSLPINFLTDITFDGWILTGWVEITFFLELILNYFCSLELAWLTSAFKKKIYEVEFKMFIV